jgi:hypothetical protein
MMNLKDLRIKIPKTDQQNIFMFNERYLFDIWCAQVSDEVIIIAPQTLTKVHFLVAKPNFYAAYITPKGIS